MQVASCNSRGGTTDEVRRTFMHGFTCGSERFSILVRQGGRCSLARGARGDNGSTPSYRVVCPGCLFLCEGCALGGVSSERDRVWPATEEPATQGTFAIQRDSRYEKSLQSRPRNPDPDPDPDPLLRPDPLPLERYPRHPLILSASLALVSFCVRPCLVDIRSRHTNKWAAQTARHQRGAMSPPRPTPSNVLPSR